MGLGVHICHKGMSVSICMLIHVPPACTCIMCIANLTNLKEKIYIKDSCKVKKKKRRFKGF